MTIDNIKSILEEVFFESEYKILEEEYTKYSEKYKRLYLKVYSEKLNKHIDTLLKIECYCIGTTILDDVFEIAFTLPTQNYCMTIPGTSTERNPKDIGDPKTFLIMTKERIKDIILINDLDKKLWYNIVEMDKKPIETIRDFKLKNIL